MALKFKKEVFKGLMKDLMDNKDNLSNNYDQAGTWLVTNFRDNNKNQFYINKENQLIDFTFTCVYYTNLINAVINKDYSAAEFSLLQMVDVFGLPISAVYEYLDVLFTPEEKANRSKSFTSGNISVEEVGDGMILSSKDGIPNELIQDILKNVGDVGSEE